MKHAIKPCVLTFVAAIVMGMPCMAQDVELPFTWAGPGSGWFISESGIEELDFDFKMSTLA